MAQTMFRCRPCGRNFIDEHYRSGDAKTPPCPVCGGANISVIIARDEKTELRPNKAQPRTPNWGCAPDECGDE